jgi:hypothetical protein
MPFLTIGRFSPTLLPPPEPPLDTVATRGNVTITEGPFVEAREVVGGVRDLRSPVPGGLRHMGPAPHGFPSAPLARL